MTMAGNGSRPIGVSVVFVLILIAGVLAVAAGIWRLVNREDGVGAVAAVASLAIGLVYLLVARGIAQGNRVARFVVALVTVLGLVTSTWTLFVRPALWVNLTIQIVLGLAVLALLYTARARQFFRG